MIYHKGQFRYKGDFYIIKDISDTYELERVYDKKIINLPYGEVNLYKLEYFIAYYHNFIKKGFDLRNSKRFKI